MAGSPSPRFARTATLASLLLGLFLALAPGIVSAQLEDQSLRTAVIVELPEEPGILAVGRPFDVLVELTGGPEAPPRFPRWYQRWGDAEIVSVEEVAEEKAGRGSPRAHRQRLTLRVFRPGTAVLPPVAIWADEAPLLTGPATVEIAAVLPPDTAGPLPPVPPKLLPGLGALWVAILLFIALTGGSLAYLYRRHLAASGPGTPGEELLQALVNLRRRTPDPVAFHHALSHALRRFLGRTLSFDGERASTRQVDQALSSARIPDRRRVPATELLQQCDAVRFGGHPTTRQVMVGRLAAARKLAHAWALGAAPLAPSPGAVAEEVPAEEPIEKREAS